MIALDSSLCQQRLEELAARITANPESPFGMPGVALFAHDEFGTLLQVYRGSDKDGLALDDGCEVCLASTGKMAVALLVLSLVDSGQVALEQPLRDASAYEYGEVGDATVQDLLSHRGRVPPVFLPGHAIYPGSLTAASLRAHCRNLSRLPKNDRGREVHYSDLAYALLTDIIESQHGRPLDNCLGLLNNSLGTRLRIGHAPGDRYLKTTGIPTPYAGTSVEPLNSVFWHRLAIPWAGICGHPVDGLRLVRAFERSSGFLSEGVRQQAIGFQEDGNATGGIDASDGHMGIEANTAMLWSPCPWGLGVEIKGTKSPHWTPREAHASSFGHVGISGTLAWHDPSAGVSWAMVGTRSSHSGWLLRHGPLLGRVVLSSAFAAP